MKRALTILSAVAAALTLQSQPAPRLLRDISHTGVWSSSPSGFVSNGRLGYFFAADENGRELWSTDGTAEGTAMVRDVAPGVLSSIHEPDRMAISGDYVYFWAADDEGIALNLWRSDGTARGTVRLTDLGPENQGVGALSSIGWHGAIFTDRYATTVYVTDGSPEGTKAIAHSISFLPFEQVASSRDAVYFAGTDELWRTDGTEAGTHLVTRLEGYRSIEELRVLNGTLFMVVRNDTFDGTVWEIWRSDGSEKGTGAFLSFRTEPRLQALRGQLMIVASTENQESVDLWTTDGTESGSHKAAVLSGTFEPYYSILAATDNLLFVSVRENPLSARAVVWRSDGTAAGTWSVETFATTELVGTATHKALFVSQGIVEPGLWTTTGGPLVMEKISSAYFDQLTPLGDSVLGQVIDPEHGTEPWISNGTAKGTGLLKNIFPDGGSWGFQPRTFDGDHVLFSALDDEHGWEPWITDGTTAGTHLLADVNPGPDSSFPVSFSDLHNGSAIFVADDHADGRELWTTDGTPAGTHLVRNLAKGSVSAFGEYSLPQFAILDGRALFFAAGSCWSTDGTEPGTTPIAELANVFGSGFLVAGRAAFAGTTSGVYETDGTLHGTARIADEGDVLGGAGSRVFFTGTGYGRSGELWVTDGTLPGTRLLKNIHPSDPNELVNVFSYRVANAAGGALYFFADDGIHGNELWRSDGTEAGTVLVKDIAPGTASSFVLVVDPPMAEYHGILYFVADDGVHGAELWRSDGTADGTYMVRDIDPEGPGSAPSGLTVAFDRLYFSANDGEHGQELWSTDGSTTSMVDDLNPGPASSSPRYLTKMGSSLLFFATRDDVGREPWVLDAPLPRRRAVPKI